MESLVTVALLGSSVYMLLTSLYTGSRTVDILYEKTTAENLARAQLEYTKSQTYSTAPTSYAIVSWVPDDFTVTATATAVTGRTNTLQKIEITVSRGGRTLVSVEDFKVNR